MANVHGITPHIGERSGEVVATFGEPGETTTSLSSTPGLSRITHLMNEFPVIAEIHLGNNINSWPDNDGTVTKKYSGERLK